MFKRPDPVKLISQYFIGSGLSLRLVKVLQRQTLGQVQGIAIGVKGEIREQFSVLKRRTVLGLNIIFKPFASISGWFAKDRLSFSPEPIIVREIIQQEIPPNPPFPKGGITDSPSLKKEDEGGLSTSIVNQIIQPKQIIEITKETRITETVKETIREFTRAADLIPIENMLNFLSAKLSSVKINISRGRTS